jgi:hypothetical protein
MVVSTGRSIAHGEKPALPSANAAQLNGAKIFQSLERDRAVVVKRASDETAGGGG